MDPGFLTVPEDSIVVSDATHNSTCDQRAREKYMLEEKVTACEVAVILEVSKNETKRRFHFIFTQTLSNLTSRVIRIVA